MKVEHFQNNFDKFKGYVERNLAKLDFGDIDPFLELEDLEEQTPAALEMKELVKSIREVATTLNASFKGYVDTKKEAELAALLSSDGNRTSMLIELLKKVDIKELYDEKIGSTQVEEPEEISQVDSQEVFDYEAVQANELGETEDFGY